MKITLELEVGVETGVVEAALEAQARMLELAAGQRIEADLMLSVTNRIITQLKIKCHNPS